MTEKDRLCRSCHWGRFNWCKDGAKISNIGNCPNWRPTKLSKAQKAKDATVMKAAHDIDVAARNAKKDIIRKKRGKK
jgi:hypothetical protein